jgi:hypothetical protein
MDDGWILIVQILQRIEQLSSPLQDLAFWKGPLSPTEHGCQILAWYQVHNQVVQIVASFKVIHDARQVGVMKIGQDLCFAGKLAPLAGRFGDSLFYSATPLEPEVLGNVKLSHPSPSQRPDDFVAFA